MITTTLNAIRKEGPCADGWAKLLKYLGKTAADNEPLPFVTILDSNGLDDALWCLRAAPEHNKIWRLFAVWCARQVQHLLTDPRSLAALDVAERYAHGLATDEELAAAEHAALNAARDDAGAVAWGSARAAWTTASVVRGAAWCAGWDAWDAARGTAKEARNAAYNAAYTVAGDAQIAEFRRIVMETAA
jgi:hypothetical protein